MNKGNDNNDNGTGRCRRFESCGVPTCPLASVPGAGEQRAGWQHPLWKYNHNRILLLLMLLQKGLGESLQWTTPRPVRGDGPTAELPTLDYPQTLTYWHNIKNLKPSYWPLVAEKSVGLYKYIYILDILCYLLLYIQSIFLKSRHRYLVTKSSPNEKRNKRRSEHMQWNW